MPDIANIGEWAGIFMKIGLPIIGLILAFIHQDKTAFQQLQTLVPDIWNVIQQELRRHGKLPDNATPMGYGAHLAQVALGKRLSPRKTALVQMMLRAHHEKMGAPDPRSV